MGETNEEKINTNANANATTGISINTYHAALKNEKLIGTQCVGCGHRQITFLALCPECGAKKFKEFECSGKGVIASFTHQNVAAEAFKDLVPYAYVIVALEEGVRTSGWMKVGNPDELAVGMAVQFDAHETLGARFVKQP